MALESFRQLILDAQAMMDPDFAGKLAADVAESRRPTPTPASTSAPQRQTEQRQTHFGGTESRIAEPANFDSDAEDSRK